MTASRVQRLIFALLVAFILNAITAAGSAWAETYYVATNGNNSGPGSESSPWRTIAYATRKMKEGDTVYVRGGVYNETDYIRISKSNVKLMNAPGEFPVIHCNYPKPSHGIFVESYERMSIAEDGDITEAPIGHITIEGFEIRRCLNGMRLNSVHDAVIRRNWIHHNDAQGILADMLRPLIDRNVINHNGGFERCAAGAKTKIGTSVCNQMHGLYLSGSDYVITNNLIYDNLAFGIHVAGYPWNLTLYNSSLKGRRGATPEYAGAKNWLVANNTIAYNGAAGIVNWQPKAVNNKYINNIFYENGVIFPRGQQGIRFYSSSGGGGNIVNNNLFYSSGAGATQAIGGGYPGWEGLYTASGNIMHADPNFVNAGPTISGVPDFHLQPSSPAIDKGASLASVTWDHAGGKRPFGPSFDIGAYEHGSPPDSGSPPPNPTSDVPPATARPLSTYNPGASLCP